MNTPVVISVFINIFIFRHYFSIQEVLATFQQFVLKLSPLFFRSVRANVCVLTDMMY
jgi:hypothetical protein